MRSLAGLIDRAPVPYTSRSRFSMPTIFKPNQTAELDAMGSVSTLFAIVNRTSGDTSRARWKLYRKAASGKPEDRTEVTTHLALKLWNRWNKFHTGQFAREGMQQHIDLVGEGWIVIVKAARGRLPLELWYVRPDRIAPVEDANDFISGYTYTSPDGIPIPLALDEVLRIQLPNPLDPYRGMGPVQSLLADLDASRYSAEWNRNFFRNSAEPGGVVEVPNNLSDPQFDQFQQRWSQSHKGVVNAHRVALLENGAKWVERKYTMRDMQFTELRGVSREIFMEAFGIHKHMLGIADDVNRANAEAAEVMHAKHLIVPRLERWKELANIQFLPMFGGDGDLEFDYESPVPEDGEDARADRESKANAAKVYVDMGCTFESVQESLDLPDTLVWEKPEPPTIVAPPGQPAPNAPDSGGKPAAPVKKPANLLALDMPEVDLTDVQAEWQAALDRTVYEYQTEVQPAQRAELAEQVQHAIDGRDLAALAALTVGSAAGAALLGAAMAALGAVAAATLVREAAAQGVAIQPASVSAATMAPAAAAVAGLLANGYAASAGREALRLYAPGTRTGANVAAAVVEHLSGLSEATLRAELGGALTRAQNSARLATLRIAPEAAYFASEVLDRNTCGPCKELHGTHFENLHAAELAYLGGPYVECKGWPKCRGTYIARWEKVVA